jgi:hypothetical protein
LIVIFPFVFLMVDGEKGMGTLSYDGILTHGRI